MNLEEKQDLRVQKTRRALAMAMLALLEREDFSKITINDICTEAMVSRSAFYAHFQDKYDLLQFVLIVMKERFFDDSEGMDTRERLVKVLLHIQENVQIFKHMTAQRQDTDLIYMMRGVFQEDYEHMLNQWLEAGRPLVAPPDIVAVYYASAITNCISYWVAKGMPHSVEEMSESLYRLLPHEITEGYLEEEDK